MLILISSFISALCSAALLLLLIRAIFSWFPGQGGAFANAIYAVTEPILFPVRKLFSLLDIGFGSPLDIPFYITCVLLAVIRMILQ